MAILLYVDDEQSIGRVVSRYFARRGDTVHVAHSVRDAVSILETEHPAAIFIDVWLGEESGFELMSWIEDQAPRLADRVTFVTGELANSVKGDKAFRTLGRPVIQKPFELAELANAVANTVADAEKRAGT